MPLLLLLTRYTKYKGKWMRIEDPEPKADPLPGSVIAFTRNGVLQVRTTREGKDRMRGGGGGGCGEPATGMRAGALRPLRAGPAPCPFPQLAGQHAGAAPYVGSGRVAAACHWHCCERPFLTALTAAAHTASPPAPAPAPRRRPATCYSPWP